jgi:hypothetical protein
MNTGEAARFHVLGQWPKAAFKLKVSRLTKEFDQLYFR